MFLVSLAPVEGMHSVMWWMLGNLEVPSYALFIAGAALCAGGCAAIWLLAPELNALTLGQQIAHTVGVRTRLATALALVCATLVTAAAVGLAGLIGFVGLIVPHAMRGLVGADHRRLVPAAALGGGAFLALCDAVARTLLAPREIPVGVVTALLGGPFFLALLHRRRRGWIA
jgi:iron complex transport system permease protein